MIVLLYPTGRCSFAESEEAEIGDVDESVEVGDSDKERVKEGLGFFSEWVDKVKVCYAENPLGAQEGWKKGLAGLFLAGMVLSWLIFRFTAPRRSKLG